MGCPVTTSEYSRTKTSRTRTAKSASARSERADAQSTAVDTVEPACPPAVQQPDILLAPDDAGGYAADVGRAKKDPRHQAPPGTPVPVPVADAGGVRHAEPSESADRQEPAPSPAEPN